MGGSSQILPRRIQPHIAVQNTWFTDADLRPFRVENGVVSISGHWFLQEGTFQGDFAAFLAKTEKNVADRLAAFRDAHPEVERDTDAVIVMDIEHPHPANLHTYSAGDRRAIVTAYRRRIAATRNVFANAKVALYGTLNPDPRGRADHPTYRARLDSLVWAGRKRLYDDLDYVVPVLYVRFGCDDEANGPCDGAWDTLDEYTRLGVDGSKRLKTFDGRSLPLFPLLGFSVNNGKSDFHRRLLMNLGVPEPVKATLGKQIGILVAGGVKQFALWTGQDRNQLGGRGDPKVTDYLKELARLGW